MFFAEGHDLPEGNGFSGTAHDHLAGCGIFYHHSKREQRKSSNGIRLYGEYHIAGEVTKSPEPFIGFRASDYSRCYTGWNQPACSNWLLYRLA